VTTRAPRFDPSGPGHVARPMAAPDQRAPVAQLLRAGEPGFRPPMLATLVEQAPTGREWAYEHKLDGYRLIAVRDAATVALWTRNRQDRTRSFPEVVDAVRLQAPGRVVLDGEVVALDGPVASFGRLQRRAGIDDERAARASGIEVVYVVFDVLHVDGVDLDRLPWEQRRGLLGEIVQPTSALRCSEVIDGDGGELLAQACADGWEGLIAKRRTAPYQPGRSRDWLKLKCLARQELVVGGWTEPAGSRQGLGALLVGYHDAGRLTYAGKVGTGFSTATLRQLRQRLEPIERRHSPFVVDSPTGRGLHWVEPRLVVEVAFTEWTGAGRLRHPRFVEVRDDKDPSDVGREAPAPPP
jgi:bifunctional non-homologous end joining protein LigD